MQVSDERHGEHFAGLAREVGGGSCDTASRRGDELLERNVWVGEAPVVDGSSLADQLLDGFVDVPDVDVHACDHTISDEPEGDELAGGGVAAEDDSVPFAGEARVLHPDLVLVGEE